MSILMLQVDRVEYRFPHGGCGGWCSLRVYENLDMHIAVLTERIDAEGKYMNDGLSVINGVEYAAHAAIRFIIACLGARGVPDMFFEHLPRRGPGLENEEEFTLVLFDNGVPRFRHMSKDAFEALIGQQWEDYPTS